jgi:putative nucleotidyltransferase with HDIG domain
VSIDNKMSSSRASAYVGLVLAAGVAILCHGFWAWNISDWTRYLSYLTIALVASGMKVALQGVAGTMSMSFLFVLIGVSEVGLPGTLLMGCLGMLVQCIFRAKIRPRPIQILFSVASMACSVEAGYYAYRWSALGGSLELPVRLLLAAAAFFVINTLSVASAIALTADQSPWTVWRKSYFWTFPNYLVGAAVAWAIAALSRAFGWQSALLLLPVLYVVYRSHSSYITRLEHDKNRAEEQRAHAEEVAQLNRRAIETLALAIEAKDQTTHDHLQRVEVYAIEVAREMGLGESQLEALRAAALLHDVGKLAVPEYIISKPGRLTPEEFEKMKTHTVVGAEIVEQIRFPYPVAPIVRSHHEKWNGGGYPDGLSGESIPIGARILAAVDCLDALASDRQYRRALPLDEAIKIVQSEAGKSYDPAVVEILARRYVELERMATSIGTIERTKLSTDLKIARGEAPAAGFQATAPSTSTSCDLMNLHNSIAGADRQERALADLTRTIAGCEDRAAIFAALSQSLRGLVPYDAMVVYLCRGDRLIPESLDGEDYRLFASLEIPIGMGLSGWVAENRKSSINGNPAVEPGYLNDPTRFSMLRSALAVPLESQERMVGVLSLYRTERDAFSPEHLTRLLSLGQALARALTLTADPVAVE